MTTTVITQQTIEGFHNWPDAPKVLEFLSFRHRHSFIIKTGTKVTLHNREKEIFTLRNVIEDFIIDKFGRLPDFGAMSCEMIANMILSEFSAYNMIWVEVWEEETGGARVEL